MKFWITQLNKIEILIQKQCLNAEKIVFMARIGAVCYCINFKVNSSQYFTTELRHVYVILMLRCQNKRKHGKSWELKVIHLSYFPLGF